MEEKGVKGKGNGKEEGGGEEREEKEEGTGGKRRKGRRGERGNMFHGSWAFRMPLGMGMMVCTLTLS